MDGKKMDIEIFPYRVLGSDTTEKLLNDIESLEDVKRTVIHGPRFPKTEETLPPQYRERRVININGENVVLKVKTGRIFVELTMESTVKKLKKSARNIFLLVLILIKTKQITSERKEQFLIELNMVMQIYLMN